MIWTCILSRHMLSWLTPAYTRLLKKQQLASTQPCLLSRSHRMHCIDAACCYRWRTWRGLCVCMFWAHGWAVKNGWIDQDAVWELTMLCGSKQPRVRWGSRSPHGKGYFWGRHLSRPVITYLCMSALCIVSLPWANVPAQRTRRTNTFAAARGNMTSRRCGHFNQSINQCFFRVA